MLVFLFLRVFRGLDPESIDVTRVLTVEVCGNQLAGPVVADSAGGKSVRGSARLTGRLHVQVQIIQVLDELRLLDRIQGLLVGKPFLHVFER